MHKIYIVMRDNSGENKSHEIRDFFEARGIQNYYSTAYEQWQNGQPESSINSLMTLARSTIVESGLGGQFWFSAMMAAKDAMQQCNIQGADSDHAMDASARQNAGCI